MKCEICGSELKALFTSNYCPNEDKHVSKPAQLLGLTYILENNSVKESTLGFITIAIKSSDIFTKIEWIYPKAPITYVFISLMIDYDQV